MRNGLIGLFVIASLFGGVHAIYEGVQIPLGLSVTTAGVHPRQPLPTEASKAPFATSYTWTTRICALGELIPDMETVGAVACEGRIATITGSGLVGLNGNQNPPPDILGFLPFDSTISSSSDPEFGY